MLPVALLLCAVGLSLAACSLLLNDDGLSGDAKRTTSGDEGGALASGDSSTPSEANAPPESNGGDAGSADAPPPDALLPNDLTNPSFEGSCAGWLTENATVDVSDLARAGTNGCLVCSIAGTPEAQFYQIVPRNVVLNEAFSGEVWVRADTREAPAPSQTATFLEVDFRADAGIDRGPSTPPNAAIGEGWQRIATAYSSRQAGNSVQLFLRFPGNIRQCVVIDTARLHKTN